MVVYMIHLKKSMPMLKWFILMYKVIKFVAKPFSLVHCDGLNNFCGSGKRERGKKNVRKTCVTTWTQRVERKKLALSSKVIMKKI